MVVLLVGVVKLGANPDAAGLVQQGGTVLQAAVSNCCHEARDGTALAIQGWFCRPVA